MQVFVIATLLAVIVMYLAMAKSFTFEKGMIVKKTPEEVWEHFEAAFTDSTQVPWPNDLEEIRSKGLQKGTVLSVTYKTPMTASTHTYTLTEVIKNKALCYSANPGHPLVGGGVIQFAPSRRGTTVRWAGEYRYRGFPIVLFYYKWYFEKRFFTQLEKQLNQKTVS